MKIEWIGDSVFTVRPKEAMKNPQLFQGFTSLVASPLCGFLHSLSIKEFKTLLIDANLASAPVVTVGVRIFSANQVNGNPFGHAAWVVCSGTSQEISELRESHSGPGY